MKKNFELICDFLIDEVIDDLKANYESLPEQEEWIRTMLEYNVKGGKVVYEWKGSSLIKKILNSIGGRESVCGGK